jgi:hypothetical protein
MIVSLILICFLNNECNDKTAIAVLKPIDAMCEPTDEMRLAATTAPEGDILQIWWNMIDKALEE